MLVNPARDKILVYPGTRILQEEFGILGCEIRAEGRVWSVQALYAPVPGRALGGIRAKLVDNDGFTSFANQRDLEVLLGIGKPGRYCPWLGKEYAAESDPEWYGLCMDDEDLIDDLYDRELILRSTYPDYIPYGLEVQRRLHTDVGSDSEELLTMLYDADPETGMGPDGRLATIKTRWVSIERNKIRWRF